VIEGVIGLDGGSTSSKAVLIDMEGDDHQEGVPALQGQPDPGHQGDPGRIKQYDVDECGAELVVKGFGATGYAADVLQESVKSDVNVVETVAHMMSAVRFFGDIDVICDNRRAGHQGPVPPETATSRTSPVEPVQRRQRHAARRRWPTSSA
jgi:activator of 2-hydroxyglutaryl-CoA dehydratase